MKKKVTLVFGSHPGGPGWIPVVMAGTGDGGEPKPSSVLLAGDPSRPADDNRWAGWAGPGLRALPAEAHGWVGSSRLLPPAVRRRLAE